MEPGQKYNYNYDMSLNWLLPPQSLVREVVSLFEHDKHGHVVKVLVTRGNEPQGTRWVRYERFNEEIEKGLWST